MHQTAKGEAMNRYLTQDDIIYFVMTDRFFGKYKQTVDSSDTRIHGGTLDGIIEKLNYLIELGVTTIWVITSGVRGNSTCSMPAHVL